MRRRHPSPPAVDVALRSVQLRALAAHGVVDDDAYGRHYRRSLRVPVRPLTERALLERLRRADVVLVGDHRTFTPSRTGFLALVADAQHPARQPLLALTDLPAEEEGRLHRFLSGRLSEESLRRSAFTGDLDGQLRFEAVAPVLRWARAEGYVALACGAPGGTAWPRQDVFVARLLAERLERSTAQLFVLAGQQRLAPSHLPAALARVLPPHRRVETVLQSCSELGRHGARGTFSLGPSRACTLHYPSAEVLQSHLDALELEPGDALLADDAIDAFPPIAELLGDTFDVDVASKLSRLRIFTPGTAGALASLPELRGADERHVVAGVLARESAYFPGASAVYLAGRSLNHAAEEAAHFVRHCAIGDALLSRRVGAQAFYARCLEEALAFFASRRVNPARPCVQPSEWAALLESEDHAEAAAFVLAHRAAQTAGPAATLGLLPPGGRANLVHAVTHGLGYLLGEALDRELAAGAMRLAEARALFHDPFPDAVDAYFALSERLALPAPRYARRSRARA